MKRHFALILCCLFYIMVMAQKQTSTVYIDKQGVMRWNDSHREASFYGVNYTLPFAHAYRAIGQLGLDHKAAIDKDVYHFARLGLNAYRIHVWDVEISDEKGNLIANEHLDLLDYLIAKLKERGIKIVITAQTNFGNGYPEKNQPTGGFSYKYDKCNIHSDAEAIAVQQTYIAGLVKHLNPYTRKAYMNDPDIVGFEVNNEPCHSGSVAETRTYINKMLDALKKAGNRKPVFYNVSHNGHVVEAYYATAIQGTTYQWYPIGLVSGHTRTGNFLPYVDQYDIPFSNIKGFDKKTRLVYEFDPADILYSYMYPAITRTFRKAGFQWITQFAYDPIDMAWANTEYQTHFLNLAYTPNKAISMKIAAEVAYTIPRNQSYGTYPNDTVFGDFRVSYLQDLSELNDGKRFYYSNNTQTQPKDAEQLQALAGCGNSPIVQYEGTGAYFIDRLEAGVWRLEVMPDAVKINDPFAKPSLKREVVTIAWGNWNMALQLPDLGKQFSVTGLNEGNRLHSETANGIICSLQPGVYLLQKKGSTPKGIYNKETVWNHIRLGEYVAPCPHAKDYSAVHQAAVSTEAGKALNIEARIVGSQQSDSVIIYTDKVSFWNEKNTYIKMERTNGYTYRGTVPDNEVKGDVFRYNIIVCRGDKRYTFPTGTKGSPLDWDYEAGNYWETEIVAPGSAIVLSEVKDTYSNIEAYAIPEWSTIRQERSRNAPMEEATLRFTFNSNDENPRYFLRKHIKNELQNREARLNQCRYLCFHIKEMPANMKAGFVTTDGYTYHAACTPSVNEIVRIPLSEVGQTNTALLPHPYPVFLKNYFKPETEIPFDINKIEQVEFVIEGNKNSDTIIETGSIWLE